MQLMHLFRLAFLASIFCACSFVPAAFSQSNLESNMPSNWQDSNCGEQSMHERRMATDATYRQQVERVNEQLYQSILRRQKSGGVEKNNTECDAGNRDAEVLIIPIVIHIIHLEEHGEPGSGSSNPSNAQILQGVSDMNDAFRNIGAYAGDGRGAKNASNPDRDLLKSRDIKIEFRLARRDINDKSSAGIIRYESDVYSNLNSMRDSEMKRWIAARNNDAYPTTDYANIYLVNRICDGNPDNAENCTTAGYAYLAGAHGASYDGVVNMARFFGSSKRNSVVHIHEFGHYLNLSHTFDGGCSNGNCLVDGDRVCDTPPDDSREGRFCGGTQNSCDADTESGPFTRDQGDMYENYMDYADWTCQNTFTQGQKERMRTTLQGIRSSLLRSEGATAVASSIAEVVEISNPNVIACDQITRPVIQVRNKGNAAILTLKIQYELNGSIRLYNWQGNIPVGATREITLPEIVLNNPGSYNLYIKLLESNGARLNANAAGFCYDFNYARAVAQLPFCQNLENGNINSSWTVRNPDREVGFQVENIGSCDTKGNYVLALQTWGQFSDRNTVEEVYTQPIDLRDYEAAFFEFDVAYATTFPNFNTILEVAISDDCGKSYQTLYRKTAGQLATKNVTARNSTDANAFFIPTNCSDWKSELIDLSEYAGQEINIRIQASTENRTNSSSYEWGNNLYLDNFCVNAERCTPPNPLTNSPLAICGDLQLEASTAGLDNNQIVAWWINNNSPITNIVNSQSSLEGAVGFTPIGNVAGLAGEGNIIFRSNAGAGKLNIPVDCEKLRSGTTYYATPFIINTDFSNPIFNACTFGTPVAFSCDCDNVNSCDLRLTGTSVQNTTDCGLNNGTITVLTNITTEVEYSLDGNTWQQNNRFAGLSAGNYNAFVRSRSDQNCIRSATNISVNEPARPQILNLITTNSADCTGGSGGTIEVSVNGNEEVEYRLNGGNWQSNPVFSDLAAGTYSVQVRNKTAKTCTSDTRSATITTPSTEAIEILSIQTYNPTSCGATNGRIVINTNLSVAEYSIDGGATWQTTNEFNQLTGGTYYPQVRDGGCSMNKGEPITLVATGTGIQATINLISNPICINQENEFSLNITGGAGPYTIIYQVGNKERKLENYSNNDPITFVPNVVLSSVKLLSIADAQGCTVEVSASESFYASSCGNRNNMSISTTSFTLYQNAPNPFQGTTHIRFDLPEADRVVLSVYNLTGQLLYQQEKELPAGYHEWKWNADASTTSGVLYYRIQTSNHQASGKMITAK